MNKHSGFTLVELVVVIILLGLLAATALPRFLSVTDQARNASVEGVAGGFASGVALVRAQFFADGHSSGGDPGKSVTMDGLTVFVNENGWPANTSDASSASFDNQTAQECLEVWNYVFQSPPAATTSAGSISNELYLASSSASGTDFFCDFDLIVDGQIDQTRHFTFNLETGQVRTTLPAQ